jgi:ADP-ribose pyrophosphatase YjhB (NUDIX family)
MKNIKQPRFVPRKGQVDFTHIRWAPVINCIVTYKSKIFLVKRSDELRLYPGYWNGISGFLDDDKSIEEKVAEEMREELGLSKKHIVSIKKGSPFDQDAPEYKKTWIVHPLLVKIDTDKVHLDWEAKSGHWLTLAQIRKLQLLPGFKNVLKSFFKL